MENKANIEQGQSTNVNPDEIGKTEAAKELKSQEKIDIKESELGREQGQTPADEHIENHMSQIDKETVKMQQDKQNSKAPINGEDDNADSHAKGEDTVHYDNEINDTDVRDQNDSTTDWDAENSKTGRHK